MLPTQLSHLGLGGKTSVISRFVECFKTMWASNGNLVSRTYTGTGAMEGGARVRRLVSEIRILMGEENPLITSAEYNY